MEKTFDQIFRETFTVLKKSISGILKVFGICFGGTVLVSLAAAAVLGMAFVKNINDSDYIQGYLQTASVSVGLFVMLAFLFLFVLYYISYCCTVLIIRNNALGYQESFKATFSKSFGKFFKALCAVILMTVIYCLIIGVIGVVPFALSIMKQNILVMILGIILSVIISIILIPPCYTGFYGILCQDGNFFSILNDSIRLGFKKWFKIFWYMLLLTIVCSIAMGISLGILIYVLRFINLLITGNMFAFTVQVRILVFAFEIIVGLFSLCYFTILYLDISGVKQPEVIMGPITPLENKPF